MAFEGASDGTALFGDGSDPQQTTAVETETQQVDTTGEQKTAQQVMDELFEVKVNKQTFKVPKQELIAGYQRNKDYTQKTMELAEERRQWAAREQQYQKQLEDVKAWLSDPANLRAAYTQVVQQRGFEDPDVPLTAAQAQQLIKAQIEQERQSMQQELQKSRESIMTESQAMKLFDEMGGVVKGLLQTHPELGTVDGIDALLYRDVSKMDPQNFEEVKAGLAEAAKARAEKIRAHFTTQQKTAAVQKAKLTNGIEPPGGKTVSATPEQKFEMGSSGGRAKLRDQIVQDLMAAALEEKG